MKEQTVETDDEGIRLDRWFKRHYPQVNHVFLEKSLRKGQVKLDGKKAKSSDRLVAGQIIRIFDEVVNEDNAPRPPKIKEKKEVTERDAKDMQRLVIYKDDHMLILNKPSGLAVQGGTGQDRNIDDMLNALKFDAKERPKLVHRIDKDTSGILVLARTTKAARVLTDAFAKKTIRKLYWALVVGLPEIPQGRIDASLAKSLQGKDSRMEKVEVDDEDGKRAISFYRVVEHLGKSISWLEMVPLTGRTHQLRVHALLLNTPIVGDGKYGGSEAFVQGLSVSNKLHLHARRIIIPPLFGKKIDIKAPLPKHMQDSWKQFGFAAEAEGESLIEQDL